LAPPLHSTISPACDSNALVGLAQVASRQIRLGLRGQRDWPGTCFPAWFARVLCAPQSCPPSHASWSGLSEWFGDEHERIEREACSFDHDACFECVFVVCVLCDVSGRLQNQTSNQTENKEGRQTKRQRVLSEMSGDLPVCFSFVGDTPLDRPRKLRSSAVCFVVAASVDTFQQTKTHHTKPQQCRPARDASSPHRHGLASRERAARCRARN
jgi:hypothetical protein